MAYYYSQEVPSSIHKSPLLTACRCNQCGEYEVRTFTDVSEEFICGSCVDEVNHVTKDYFSKEWY